MFFIQFESYNVNSGFLSGDMPNYILQSLEDFKKIDYALSV